MNSIADRQDVILKGDDLNEHILEVAAKIGSEQLAPEVPIGTPEFSSWVASTDQGESMMPLENEKSIAEQLVEAGNEQADHDQRAASQDDERSNLNSAFDDNDG